MKKRLLLAPSANPLVVIHVFGTKPSAMNEPVVRTNPVPVAANEIGPVVFCSVMALTTARPLFPVGAKPAAVIWSPTAKPSAANEPVGREYPV
jgi:hypothetical protein